MNILWIGNSFTFYNDLPSMFENMAFAADIDVRCDRVVKGGWTLLGHANPEDISGAQVDKKLKKSWDIVILQEQSRRPATHPELYEQGVTALLERCGRSEVILNQTWPHDHGSAGMAADGLNKQDMYLLLRQNIRALGDKLGLRVCPVGDKAIESMEKFPELIYYAPDHFHPAPTLSYICACCFFQLIFDAPIPENFTPENMTEQQAQMIRSLFK